MVGAGFKAALVGLFLAFSAQTLDFVEDCMSFDARQFRECIIRPTLKALEPEIPHSIVAEELLMLTAAQESHLGTYLKQKGGPALGVYQMEPATHVDLYRNFIQLRPSLAEKLRLMVPSFPVVGSEILVGNLYYATAIARVHYFRVAEPLPSLHTEALAKYWKKHWNTELGKGTVNEALANYARYING
mgnify:CR=1 FL=1